MASRKELAKRIKQFRAVGNDNDPTRGYRRMANECRTGKRSYHQTFGMAKHSK